MWARSVSGRVLSQHYEHHSEDERKPSWSPICNRSIREDDADDRRAKEEDPAERKHDPKSPGDEAKLAPDATRTKRKDHYREHHEKDQPNEKAAHLLSVSEGIERPGQSFILRRDLCPSTRSGPSP
jgi:hypothetical protein